MYLITWVLSAVCVFLLRIKIKVVCGTFRNMVLQCENQRHQLPPGPRRLPFIGSSYVFRNGIANTIHKLSRVYGKAFTVYTFSSPTICINSTDLVKKICQDERFQNRPIFPKIGKLLEDADGRNGGIIVCNGETWKQNRNVVLRHLRMRLANSADERICHTEVDCLIERIRVKSSFDKDISLHMEVVITTASILSRLLFGDTAPIDTPHLKNYCVRLMQMLHAGSAIGVTMTILKHFPWLKEFPFPGLKVVNDYNHCLEKLFNALSTKADNGKSEDEVNSRTFSDAYLEAVSDPKVLIPKRQLMDELLLLMSDLYIGGTDTTSCTILHALRVLAMKKQHQDKLFLEIKGIVESGESIETKSRRRMHFTNAFLHEILRMEPAASAGIPRRSDADAYIDGIWFPKGVTVLCNIYGAHREEKYWENPDVFRPERFLDENGIFHKKESQMSFSVGKRRCPGEALALKEVFLVVVSLVKAFEILPPQQEDLNMETRYGFTSFPRDFKLRFKPRK